MEPEYYFINMIIKKKLVLKSTTDFFTLIKLAEDRDTYYIFKVPPSPGIHLSME
jgi:hypothetical protein